MKTEIQGIFDKLVGIGFHGKVIAGQHKLELVLNVNSHWSKHNKNWMPPTSNYLKEGG